MSLLGAGSFVAAVPQEGMRDITKDWQQKRPGSQSSTKKVPIYSIRTRIPKKEDLPESSGDSEIGVTIWRYRPSRPGDEVRDLIQPKSEGAKEEWSVERVEAETVLSDNQMIRLTIESLRTGYLYIIDRAKYDDGTYGEPYLIFPTMRIKEGENAVRAGRPVQIPSPRDDQPYLQLRRGRSKNGSVEVSEELTLLVTPLPIGGFSPGPDRVKLSAEHVELLKQQYIAPVERSEMQGGAGMRITKKEDLAVKDPIQLLAADDPYPQTIYRVAAGPRTPILVVLELRVQAANQGTGQ